MRGVALFLGILCGSFAGVYVWQTNTRLEALAAENKELRLKDASLTRRKQLDSGRRLELDKQEEDMIRAIAGSIGASPSIVLDLAVHENGSPLERMGHKGKTGWVAKGTPPKEWQYWEASITLNQVAWGYIEKKVLRTREGRESFYNFAAEQYTGPEYRRQWASSMRGLYVRNMRAK